MLTLGITAAGEDSDPLSSTRARNDGSFGAHDGVRHGVTCCQWSGTKVMTILIPTWNQMTSARPCVQAVVVTSAADRSRRISLPNRLLKRKFVLPCLPSEVIAWKQSAVFCFWPFNIKYFSTAQSNSSLVAKLKMGCGQNYSNARSCWVVRFGSIN